MRLADERLLRSKTVGGSEMKADEVRRSMQGQVEGFSMLNALVTAVDNKDRYTRRHSEEVVEYSLRIARQMGLDDEAQHMMAVAALLHDIGKVGIPDSILRKPGQLSEEEFRTVKQHAEMGAVIISTVPGLAEIIETVRHHHERWDGQGYPLGLQGEETPLWARLMAGADAFSAMRTDRPYRKAMSQRQACEILEMGAGTQWDAACVFAFLQTLKN